MTDKRILLGRLTRWNRLCAWLGWPVARFYWDDRQSWINSHIRHRHSFSPHESPGFPGTHQCIHDGCLHHSYTPGAPAGGDRHPATAPPPRTGS